MAPIGAIAVPWQQHGQLLLDSYNQCYIANRDGGALGPVAMDPFIRTAVTMPGIMGAGNAVYLAAETPVEQLLVQQLRSARSTAEAMFGTHPESCADPPGLVTPGLSAPVTLHGIWAADNESSTPLRTSLDYRSNASSINSQQIETPSTGLSMISNTSSTFTDHLVLAGCDGHQQQLQGVKQLLVQPQAVASDRQTLTAALAGLGQQTQAPALQLQAAQVAAGTTQELVGTVQFAGEGCKDIASWAVSGTPRVVSGSSHLQQIAQRAQLQRTYAGAATSNAASMPASMPAVGDQLPVQPQQLVLLPQSVLGIPASAQQSISRTTPLAGPGAYLSTGLQASVLVATSAGHTLQPVIVTTSSGLDSLVDAGAAVLLGNNLGSWGNGQTESAMAALANSQPTMGQPSALQGDLLPLVLHGQQQLVLGNTSTTVSNTAATGPAATSGSLQSAEGGVVAVQQALHPPAVAAVAVSSGMGIGGSSSYMFSPGTTTAGSTAPFMSGVDLADGLHYATADTPPPAGFDQHITAALRGFNPAGGSIADAHNGNQCWGSHSLAGAKHSGFQFSRNSPSVEGTAPSCSGAGSRTRPANWSVMGHNSAGAGSAASTSSLAARCAPKWASSDWNPLAQAAAGKQAAKACTATASSTTNKPPAKAGSGVFLPPDVRKAAAAVARVSAEGDT